MVVNQPVAHRYREVAVRTANPLQLIVILYDSAIQALQEAQQNLKRNDIAARARCINKSVSIISELQVSLNFEVGGELAGTLDRLYNYMRQRIFQANVDQAPEPLAEVVTLLGNLRSAWNELANQSAGADIAASSLASSSAPAIKSTLGTAVAKGSLNISG